MQLWDSKQLLAGAGGNGSGGGSGSVGQSPELEAIKDGGR